VKTIVLQVGDPVMVVDAVHTFIDATGAVPVIIQGRTMLPVRAIVEALGGTISWDATRRAVGVVLDKSGLTALSFTVPAGLLTAGTYSWTVTATGPGGTSAPQASSFTFIVKDAVIQPLAQTVEMHVKYSSWDPSTIHIKAGARITWNIWGDEVTSCTNRIVVPSLSISQALVAGKNVITFTAPSAAGIVPFACWMNMVRGQFIVDP
jgi:hypothetical protein